MDTAVTVGARIKKLNVALKQNIDRKLTDLDLTGSQSFVLRYLAEQEGLPIYPKDIEKRFSLTHPTVSGIVQRLEGKGFIRTEEDKNDRRCRRIFLTEKAKKCTEEIAKHICSMEKTMMQGMTEEEVSTFKSVLDKAIENLLDSVKEEESQ